MIQKLCSISVIVSLIIALCACQSVPSEVPEDWTSDEIMQRAQEYFDKGEYEAALFMYETMKERYSQDLAVLVAAEFEIAHIKIKQNKYDEARPLLEDLIARYESSNASSLPAEYLKLARIDLAKITEKK